MKVTVFDVKENVVRLSNSLVTFAGFYFELYLLRGREDKCPSIT